MSSELATSSYQSYAVSAAIDFSTLCGAVLFHPDLLLTNKSCDTDYAIGSTVRIGGTHFSEDDQEWESVQVLEKITLEQIIGDEDNIMIVRISPSSKIFSSIIFDYPDDDDATVVKVGFRSSYGIQLSDLYQQKFSNAIIQNEECTNAYKEDICIQTNGVDQCIEDYGSPLFDDDGFVLGLAGDFSCSGGISYYTGLGLYRDFIEDAMCNKSQVPHCDSPTQKPSMAPSSSAPTMKPSQSPTKKPSIAPSSSAPTMKPTRSTTKKPAVAPSTAPTMEPTLAPALSPDDDPICFSGSNIVFVQGKGHVLLNDIKIGDRVQSSLKGGVDGGLTYSQVISFSHRDIASEAKYLQIFTMDSKVPLEISHHHMIMKSDRSFVRAKDVQVGNELPGGLVVTKIHTIMKQGLYAPVTETGTIVVSGIVASNYVALLNIIPTTVQHYACHAYYAFKRMVCKIDFDRFCVAELYTVDGYSRTVFSAVNLLVRIHKFPPIFQLAVTFIVLPVIVVILMVEKIMVWLLVVVGTLFIFIIIIIWFISQFVFKQMILSKNNN